MSVISNFDFSLEKYKELCIATKKSKYQVVTLAQYLQKEKKESTSYAIMRHDIDRMPQRALEMAEVEYQCGVQSTYYFRAQKGTYIPEIMGKIASFGHEIGYHYETVDTCKGNIVAAQQLFSKVLADFRSKYDVKTVCAHGNPLTKYNNGKIWDNLNLSDFELLGEPYLSLDYEKFAYFSDSGRTWLNNESQKMEGKDSVSTAFNDIRARKTDDIIRIVKEGKPPNICILSHSERWSNGVIRYFGRYVLDLAFSYGKVVIYLYRKIGKDK